MYFAAYIADIVVVNIVGTACKLHTARVLFFQARKGD